jgi:uncharacterized protein
MKWRELPRSALILLLQGYRLLLSPWLGSQCRFEPTCSLYAIGALEAHGAAGGCYLTARRLLRCHPWCDGGHDPVPVDRPRLFQWHAHVDAPASTPPHSSKTSS